MSARPPTRRAWLAACLLVGVVVTTGTIGWRAHRNAQERATLAQMDRLPPDAPLERWLPFTGMTGLPAVVARARETIQARPHLTFDLVGCLRRDDAPTRALALAFVRGGGLPAAPAESIPAAREALQAEAASMRARVEAQPDLTAAAFDPECLEAVFLVAQFTGHEAAFVGPLREMRAVLDGLPRTQPIPAGEEELDIWLRAHAPERVR